MKKFEKFWEDIDVPLHRIDNDEHYQIYARELSLLFMGRHKGEILELGCGNGALYKYLGFDSSKNYIGIDFSPAMVKRFKLSFPELDVQCHDASTFVLDKKFDLIFSNAMIQNFDNNMLKQHFINASNMLKKDGLFICASYPAAALKMAYYSGEAGPDPKNSSVINWLLTMLFRSHLPMGQWHYNKDIAILANEIGFECQFFGSLNYLYRNHVVMSLK